MKILKRTFGKQAGMGLVEVSISATILLLLAATMVEAVAQVGALGKAGSVNARLQLGAQDAITRITADLKSAGFVNANGKTYPYLYEDGDADSAFAVHGHAPANEYAQDDEPDFGVNRGIVFVRPTFEEMVQDVDGNNWPLVDGNGDANDVSGVQVVKRYQFPAIGNDGSAGFQAEEVSYVLVTAADGVNELQRRVDGAISSVVARGVERLVFDTSITDPVGVPVGAVRVRLWLRLRDEGGTVHRQSTGTVVRLQNGG